VWFLATIEYSIFMALAECWDKLDMVAQAYNIPATEEAETKMITVQGQPG
jgi:hypothetical protein